MSVPLNSFSEFRRKMLGIAHFTFANDDTYTWVADKALTKILVLDAGTDDKEYRDRFPRIVVSRDGIVSQRINIDNQNNMDLETYEHTIVKNRSTTAYFTIRAQELVPLEYLADQLESGMWFAKERLSPAGILMASPPHIGAPQRESGYWELTVSAAFTFMNESRITYEDEDLILNSIEINLTGENGTKVEAKVD